MFSAAGIRGDHKQVESGETGKTSEQPMAFLKASTAEDRATKSSNLNPLFDQLVNRHPKWGMQEERNRRAELDLWPYTPWVWP